MKTEYQTRCLSIAETALLLGICKTKVYELVRRGDLPHLRLDRRIVIPELALLRWIQDRQNGGTNDGTAQST